MTASAAGGGRPDCPSLGPYTRTRAADPRGVLPNFGRSLFSFFLIFFFWTHTDTQTAGGEVRA